MNFKGKHILITQNALCNYRGSEIVTLELAKFFKNKGAKVAVFTWFFNDPIKSEFEKNEIYVTTDDHDRFFDSVNYVWVHHQTLPLSILERINKNIEDCPCFIFYHMSYMKELFLEQPYIYNLEKNLADKSIFVSEEALDMNMEKFGSIFRKPSIFRNASPDEFITCFKTHSTPKKIGIVSNHPPEELIKAFKEIKKNDIDVDLIGNGFSIYKLVTPEILNQYDCIIAIGKTVQYCLTSNIPIYLYDHFGGCGYLDKNNFDKAQKANFSGRGFNKKSSSQITTEIINGYNEARIFQEENLKLFQQQFSLSNNIAELFKEIAPRHKTPFTAEYTNYIVAAERLAKDKIIAENTLNVMIPEMKNTIANLKKEIVNLNNTIVAMNNSRIIKIDKKIRDAIKKIKRFPHQSKHPEIILVSCVYNEETNMKKFLNYIEKYIDGIVIIDDNSSDNTVKILKSSKKLLSVISTNNNHKDNTYNERQMRERVIKEAKRVAKTNNPFVLCIDPDERPEKKFLKNLHAIANKFNGKKEVITVHYRELWNSPTQWRSDGIWGEKIRPCMFQLADNMTFSFKHQYHVPWAYDEIVSNNTVIDYNLYHLKMIRPDDRKKRKNLYKSLDPKKKIQKIGYDYLDDETNLQLTSINPSNSYDINSVPNYYKEI